MDDFAPGPPKEVIYENTYITEPEGYGPVRPHTGLDFRRVGRSCSSASRWTRHMPSPQHRLPMDTARILSGALRFAGYRTQSYNVERS